MLDNQKILLFNLVQELHNSVLAQAVKALGTTLHKTSLIGV